MAFGFGMGFPRNAPFAGGPSLNLQFAGNTVLDPAITFTRALNTATYFDSAGLLTTANANVPRFDYDPATLAPRGLLIEEARTNLILQSRDMTQAAWTKTDVTPNRNQVGLDGVANTACLMTEGSAGAAAAVQSGAAVTAGSTVTSSIVLKRGNTDWIRVSCRDTTGTDGSDAWFNLNTGAKGTVSNVAAGTLGASTITNLGGGWYRCTVTSLPNGTYTVPRIAVSSANANGSTTRVSGATYIVDCAQLEVGAFATSIIPTTTTTLTRNADVASITGTNFSAFYSQTAWTVYAEYAGIASGSASGGAEAPYIFGFNNSGTAGFDGYALRDNLNTTSRPAINGRSGATVPNVALSYGAYRVAGQIYKAAGAMDSGGLYVTADAKTVATTANTVFGLDTQNQMLLGFADTGGTVPYYLNGWLRRITYYPRRLSNAELQAITS